MFLRLVVCSRAGFSSKSNSTSYQSFYWQKIPPKSAGSFPISKNHNIWNQLGGAAHNIWRCSAKQAAGDAAVKFPDLIGWIVVAWRELGLAPELGLGLVLVLLSKRSLKSRVLLSTTIKTWLTCTVKNAHMHTHTHTHTHTQTHTNRYRRGRRERTKVKG